MMLGDSDATTPTLKAADDADRRGRKAVFLGKLRPPELPVQAVDRVRLYRTLDAGLAVGSVIVTAPAGSGKTTLLAAWASRPDPGRDVAWVTLGRTERDPVRFLSHVIAAIESTEAGAEAVPALRRGPASPSLDNDYLASVAETMAGLPHDVVLVLDDFHHVIGSESENLLRRVLRYPADRVRLVVLAREEPDLGQMRLRLGGHLHEIGPDELAFTRDEVVEVFDRHGVDLDREASNAVLRETRGWTVAVDVLASSAWNGSPSSEAVGVLVGTLAKYLDQEVLDEEPPEVRQFLLQAATADPVCGGLVDALTGTSGGARTLADLYRRRLFLERDEPLSDERCTWYRWHPVFLDRLRSRVVEEDPERATRLHRTAAEWLRAHGFPVEAVRHALAGADSPTAAEILGESWVDLVIGGRREEVQSLLSRFEEEQVAYDPELALVAAFDAAVDRDLPLVETMVGSALQGSTGLPSARRHAVQELGAILRLRVATLSGRPDDPELHATALALLDKTAGRPAATRPARRRRVLLLYHLGSFEVSQWRYDEAAVHLDAAVLEAASLGIPQLILRARAQLTTLDLVAGRLDLVGQAAQDVLEEATLDGWNDDHGLVSAHLALGGLHRRRHDPAAALRSVSAARSLVHPADQVNRFRIGTLSVLTLLQLGDVSTAERELEDLRRQLDRWEPPAWVHLLRAVAEAAWLRQAGDLDSALRVLEAEAADAGIARHNRFWRTTYSGLLLDAGRAAEARALVEPLIADRSGRLLELDALVVDAVAAADLGLTDEAMLSLSLAVRQSVGGHIVEPFASRAAQVRPLLARLAAYGTAHEAWVSELLERLAEASAGPAVENPSEPLTDREIEVLRAIPGASTNEEIAGQLFISVNTLRTHLKNIHRKLGTRTRNEAVARARALGLLRKDQLGAGG